MNIATIDKVNGMYEVNVSISPTYMAAERRTKTCEFLGEFKTINDARKAVADFFNADVEIIEDVDDEIDEYFNNIINDLDI